MRTSLRDLEAHEAAACSAAPAALPSRLPKHLPSPPPPRPALPAACARQDLIQQLSRDVLEAAPGVSWDDIAGLGALPGEARHAVAGAMAPRLPCAAC